MFRALWQPHPVLARFLADCKDPRIGNIYGIDLWVTLLTHRFGSVADYCQMKPHLPRLA